MPPTSLWKVLEPTFFHRTNRMTVPSQSSGILSFNWPLRAVREWLVAACNTQVLVHLNFRLMQTTIERYRNSIPPQYRHRFQVLQSLLLLLLWSASPLWYHGPLQSSQLLIKTRSVKSLSIDCSLEFTKEWYLKCKIRKKKNGS